MTPAQAEALREQLALAIWAAEGAALYPDSEHAAVASLEVQRMHDLINLMTVDDGA